MTKLSVEQALLKAKSHEKKGEFAEAKELYEGVLRSFPKNKRVQQSLANLAKRHPKAAVKGPSQEIINQLATKYNKGQLGHVVEQAMTLTRQYPDAHVIWNILGAANKGLGNNIEAEIAFKKVTMLNPNFAQGFSNLGVVLQEQGKLEEALEAFRKALLITPNYAEAYHNMGVALKDQGKPEKAIEAYKKALSIKPDYAEAYNNMGNAFKDLGMFDQAIEAYSQTLLLKPNHAGAYNNMGIALKDIGKLEEAIEAYDKAISLEPDYAVLYKNKGNALKDQGKLEETIKTYKTALSLKPDFAEVWMNGAAILESWNKLEELALWLENAFQVFENAPPDIQLFKAKLLWRNKEFEDANKIISDIDIETITEIRKTDYLNLKAKSFEKSKNFDQAFDSFSQMNSLAKNSHEFVKCRPEIYFEGVRDQLSKLKSGSIRTSTVHSSENAGFNPVFLVGFPRSGTTLLDTILRSHSKIEVVEEQPAINAAQSILRVNEHDEFIDTLLPEKLISEAKKAYKEEFDKHIEEAHLNSVYIDKMPLNILNIPLIQQLYPGSKFIFALRHPLDSILSCWMQDFKLNAAMANLVDLDRTVEFYCAAMEIFQICRAEYNLNVHKIRYEDLLEDLKGETSSLLNFLDLNWEPQMENYTDTAKKRGKIFTPSYSQVVQPIYKEAKYRWVKYEKHLNQYLEQVRPWIDEFGYGDAIGS